MRHRSPHTAGSARTVGNWPPERSEYRGRSVDLELVPRLQAIVDELRLLDADHVDVPLTLAESLLEHRGDVMPTGRPRLTGLQALCLTILGLLDTSRRELHKDEYRMLLEIVATRLARDIATDALADEREAA